MAIAHSFVSAKADGGDATLVRPGDWNAAHSGRGTMANMPDGPSGQVLTAQGAGADPAYAATAASPTRSAPARLKDTIYENTSGKPILVAITVQAGVANSGGRLEIGAASPPGTVIGRNIHASVGDNSMVVGLIPTGWFYRLATLVGALAITYWEEITW